MLMESARGFFKLSNCPPKYLGEQMRIIHLDLGICDEKWRRFENSKSTEEKINFKIGILINKMRWHFDDRKWNQPPLYLKSLGNFSRDESLTLVPSHPAIPNTDLRIYFSSMPSKIATNWPKDCLRIAPYLGFIKNPPKLARTRVPNYQNTKTAWFILPGSNSFEIQEGMFYISMRFGTIHPTDYILLAYWK